MGCVHWSAIFFIWRTKIYVITWARSRETIDLCPLLNFIHHFANLSDIFCLTIILFPFWKQTPLCGSYKHFGLIHESTGGTGETGAHVHNNDSKRGAEGKGEDYSTSQAIRTLAEAVQEIRKDMKYLKRKQKMEDETPSKKTCTDMIESPQASTSQTPDQISE